MGQVFKAVNTKLQTVVAVKTLHKDLVANARAMDRFRQEIEAAAQLDHPNIVKVRDADEIDSRPFLVMDYIDAVNLSHRVKVDGPLPIHTAAECIRQAAVGLQHAFERGVVHRDIKPANLLMESANGLPANPQAADFCVKILDFGLARFDSERRYSTRLTQPGSTLGTVDYMAPEQAESARDADTRSDVYGLGCTLFFLLTCKPPFPGTSIAEKVAARLKAAPPSVRSAARRSRRAGCRGAPNDGPPAGRSLPDAGRGGRRAAAVHHRPADGRRYPAWNSRTRPPTGMRLSRRPRTWSRWPARSPAQDTRRGRRRAAGPTHCHGFAAAAVAR